METVCFTADPQAFEKAHQSFARLSAKLHQQFQDARIEHVGSTALPGSLTKGDLDIQIVVPRDTFRLVVEHLARSYACNLGAFSSGESASFKDDAADPSVGIHGTPALTRKLYGRSILV